MTAVLFSEREIRSDSEPSYQHTSQSEGQYSGNMTAVLFSERGVRSDSEPSYHHIHLSLKDSIHVT
jgi:hypothetical protein